MSQKQRSAVFAFFDGDNVGSTLEILLIEGKLEKAMRLSTRLKETLDGLCQLLATRDGVDILIAGGDDLLIRFDKTLHGIELLADIRKTYSAGTGLKLSCGTGASIIESVNNLRLAKLYGKNQIKGPVQW